MDSMSLEPFNFIHTTALLLGQPIDEAGSLVDNDHRIADEATLTAFHRVIDAAIERDVEFLLLTGHTFDARRFTDRARIELEAGLKRLSEHGIPAFIVPGTLDPSDVWRKEIDLPDGVTFFDREDDVPVVVTSRGKDICCVYPVTLPDADEARWRAAGPAVLQETAAPYRIGLVAAGSNIGWDAGPFKLDGTHTAATLTREAIDRGVNYLALGQGRERQTHAISHGVAHDPGAPQGMLDIDLGPRGCSLVSIDEKGRANIEMLPIAVVRRESFDIELTTEMSKDDLVAHMSLTLLDRDPLPGEELWLINWVIKGNTPLLSWIDEASEQKELTAAIEKELDQSGPARRHSYVLVDRPEPKPKVVPKLEPVVAMPQRVVAKIPDREPVVEIKSKRHPEPVAFTVRSDAPLWEQLREALDEAGVNDIARLRHDAKESTWRDTTWGRMVYSQFERSEDTAILVEAEKLGQEWLGED